MAAKKPREIIFLDASFQPFKITAKDEAIITTFKVFTKFDQLLADAMGVKDSIYDANGQLRTGVRHWGLELLLFGPSIIFEPVQANLFNNRPIAIDALQIDKPDLIHSRDEETLRISFEITLAGVPYQLLEFFDVVKKGKMKITVQPKVDGEDKQAREQAMNLGLFKDAAAEPDPDEEQPQEGEPPELKGAALASWRTVMGRTPRVPDRSTIETPKSEQVKSEEEMTNASQA